MDYYVGNGVYDYLIESEYKKDFFWTVGNIWLLVYGDKDSNPKVLSVVSAGDFLKRTTQEEKSAIYYAKMISEKTGVPFNFIRFNPNSALKKVQYWDNRMEKVSEITDVELRDKFKEYGLETNSSITKKGINDKSSSPYHDWQRSNLGSSVTVADIDLLRHIGEEIVEVLELKRSYIDLDKWEPYIQDYSNFELISKLFKKANVDFYIIYNKRTFF